MIQYKSHTFFLVPIQFDKFDMDFNVFNQRGELIGTVLSGVRRPDLFTEKEQEEIEEILHTTSIRTEARLKFTQQFGIQVEIADQLGLTAVEIIDLMEKKWAISAEIMDEVLANHVA